jgi:hypothetical protein
MRPRRELDRGRASFPGGIRPSPRVTNRHTAGVAAGGPPLTSSVVDRYAVGSSTPSESFTCTGSNSPVSFDDPDVPGAPWHYTDTPTYATDWLGLESNKSATVDVGETGPGMSITYLVTGTIYGTDWTGAITGMADGGTNSIAGVSVAILDTTTNQWWDGSSFDQEARPSCPSHRAVQAARFRSVRCADTGR